jgi:hypothetical protein
LKGDGSECPEKVWMIVMASIRCNEVSKNSKAIGRNRNAASERDKRMDWALKSVKRNADEQYETVVQQFQHRNG